MPITIKIQCFKQLALFCGIIYSEKRFENYTYCDTICVRFVIIYYTDTVLYVGNFGGVKYW